MFTQPHKEPSLVVDRTPEDISLKGKTGLGSLAIRVKAQHLLEEIGLIASDIKAIGDVVDRTPFVETEILLALIEEDEERAEGLLKGMSTTELIELQEAAVHLSALCWSKIKSR